MQSLQIGDLARGSQVKLCGFRQKLVLLADGFCLIRVVLWFWRPSVGLPFLVDWEVRLGVAGCREPRASERSPNRQRILLVAVGQVSAIQAPMSGSRAYFAGVLSFAGVLRESARAAHLRLVGVAADKSRLLTLRERGTLRG